MKRIVKKRSFGLCRLEEFTPGLTDKLLDYLQSRGKKRILLLNAPYGVRLREINELEKRISIELAEALSSESAVEADSASISDESSS